MDEDFTLLVGALMYNTRDFNPFNKLGACDCLMQLQDYEARLQFCDLDLAIDSKLKALMTDFHS